MDRLSLEPIILLLPTACILVFFIKNFDLLVIMVDYFYRFNITQPAQDLSQTDCVCVTELDCLPRDDCTKMTATITCLTVKSHRFQNPRIVNIDLQQTHLA